jgi:putative ABC transport system permease protein
LLAFTFILDERGFDQFHSKADRIFRVNKNNTEPSGDISKNAETPGLMAAALKGDFPEVEAAAHVAPWFDEVLATHETASLSVRDWVFADENFFQLFDFNLLQGGDPSVLLTQPGNVLITPSVAQGLFGNEDPLGKSFQGLSDKMYTVVGIIEESPRQSHLRYEVIASWASITGDSGFLDFSFMNNWLGQTVYTYVLLNDPDQMEAINDKLPAFTARYMSNRVDVYDFYLQPLSERG